MASRSRESWRQNSPALAGFKPIYSCGPTKTDCSPGLRRLGELRDETVARTHPCFHIASTAARFGSSLIWRSEIRFHFRGLLARPKRFELLTPRFVVWCSIQLSYGRCLCQARTGKRGRGGRGIAKGLVRRWQGFGSARLRFDIRVGLAVPRKARRELPSDSPVDLGFRAVSEPACQARVPFTAVRTAINNSSWRL